MFWKSYLLHDYKFFSYCFFIFFMIPLVIFLLSYILAPAAPDAEKYSSYECGFDPFDDARNIFDIKFYLVAIMFMIFDIEVAYMMPWVITLCYQTFFGYIVMILFIIILTFGFIYEWQKGVMDWSLYFF